MRADDPRRHVVACAGAPICASAHIASRAHRRPPSPRRRAVARRHVIHVSGCAKGCAHAAPAALTVVGTPERLRARCQWLGPRRAVRRRCRRMNCRSDRELCATPQARGRSCLNARRLSARRHGDLRALVRHHPRRGRSVALLGGGSRCRGAHDPCLRPGRGGAAYRIRRRPGRRGARRARGRRADPVRLRDGGARRHAGAAAGEATR